MTVLDGKLKEKSLPKAYNAYAGNKYASRTAETPRKAALAFFEANPKARKCDVIEGRIDGPSFIVIYGRASEGNWPQSFKDVTKKTAGELPDVNPNEPAQKV